MRMPSAETVTKVWVIGGFVVTVLYDLWPALTPARGDTISELFNRKVTPNPFLMLAAGILLAHLLIPAGEFAKAQWRLAVDNPVYPLAVGLYAGLCFWSQVR